MRRLTLALLAALLAVTALAGCSGDKKAGDKAGDLTPTERLAAAKDSMDQAEFIGFTLATEKLPDGLNGLLTAKGTGTHDPAFTGTVKVQSDLTIDAQLIALDGKVYAEFPFVGWTDLDPADYGAPDPAALMDTDRGISSLLTALTDVKEGDQQRNGSEILTTIEGQLPGDAVKAVFPSAGSDSFDASFTLSDDNELRSATISGAFYEGKDDVTYTIDLDLDAPSVDIKKP